MTAIEIPTPDPRTLDDTARPFAEAVASQYAIKRVVGRGGMGIVYLARDRRLDRLVAVKTLPPQLAGDPAVRERFLRETRMAGALSHPNIVPVHRADEVDGHVFFVMGYVDGESLAAHVAAHGRLEPRVAARWLRDVAAALAHAHPRGIIHRDIKAENILVDRASGRALVTDFGIARLAEAGPLTATGQLLGTVYYVSPEQVAGDRIDARSDLYSLGVVGFLACTGRFPFEGDLASAVLVAHVTKPAPSVAAVRPDVPRSLAAIVDRCLRKDPVERFATADELLAALDVAIAELDRPAAPANPGARVSDTEAQAVWRRAAELQASTGVHPRGLPVAGSRARASRAATGAGLSLGDVREAAAEVGIDTRYLDHALVEHGLAGTRAAPPLPRERRPRPGLGALWAGAPVDIVVETEVDGELPPYAFERLITVLRDGTATLGVTPARSRELVWQGAWLGHRLEVTVVPDGGRTRIRLAQSLRRAAAGSLAATVGLVGGVAAPLLAALVATVLPIPAPEWSIALTSAEIGTIVAGVGSGTALASIPLGRSLVRWVRRRNAARLGTLAGLLAATAREAIAEE